MKCQLIAKAWACVALTAVGSISHAQLINGVGERPITRKEVSAFVGEQFESADVDKDGSVTRAELQSLREGLGRQDRSLFDEMVAGSFDDADIDADGEISLWEAEQRAAQLFDLVDLNQDGVASTDEQKTAAAVTNFDASDLKQFFADFGFTR